MSGDLRALAEAADRCMLDPACDNPAHTWFLRGELAARFDEDAADFEPDIDYIAAANPAAILALLDERDALAAKVARAEALADEWEVLADYVNDRESTADQRARSRAGVIAAEDLRAALEDRP